MNNVSTQSSSAPLSQNVPGCPNEKSDLSEKQQSAVDLLLLGKSVGTLAKMLGIDRRTLYRWRQDELFREELDRRRQELWGEMADRIRGMVQPSLDILEEQLADGYDKVRYRAATTILRLSDIRKAVPVS